MKQDFLKAKTGTIRITVYQDNRYVLPTSAKITLYSPTGGELQAQATATINADTGEMTYSLTAVHTASNNVNYKAVWEYVSNGVTYYETQLFDVYKSLLSIPIVDKDLYDELESLREQNVQEQGTATAGTTSTVVDTARRKEMDDYWKGGKVSVISGTNEGEERAISGFVKSTSTITVTPIFTSAIDTTSIYVVEKSYTDKIAQAFDDLCTMIYNKGNRHNLILESSQLKFPLIFLTLYKIALDLSSDEGDKWDRLSIIYDKRFSDAFGGMKVEYDLDESGSIVGQDEEGRNLNTFTLERA